MTLLHKTEPNNATCSQEIVQIGRRRNNRGARDLRLDSGAHPGSPSQLCWGLDGTGQSQPETIREDAVNSPGANPIQEMLIINNISCNDAMRTTFTDVKGSRRTVKRNPTNSMTGTFSRLYLKEKSWSVRSTNATRHWWTRQTAGPTQARQDQVLAKVWNLATGWEL